VAWLLVICVGWRSSKAMVEERRWGKGGHLMTNSDKGDEQRQTATNSYKQLQTVTKSDKQLQTVTNRDKINIIVIPMNIYIYFSIRHKELFSKVTEHKFYQRAGQTALQ
jgi:hypothetical protein